jgi:hypothetical protein
VKEDATPGRLCDACGTVQPRHTSFWIVPGVVKSICGACSRDGFVFTSEGRVTRGSRLALQAALDARQRAQEDEA